MNNKVDKGVVITALYYIAVIIIIIFIICSVIHKNNSTKDAWNNGICPNDNTKYVLADYNKFNSLKTYICPECGNEVERY